jgi:beta-lactamase regulating signal transducer with metallopeptidase domain
VASSATNATFTTATLFSFCIGQWLKRYFSAFPSLSLWYVVELCMERKSLIKTASCVTAGGVSVLHDFGQAERSVKAPQTSTEQRQT